MMAGIVAVDAPTAGVSRSGRVRKKSAKVIEMEETEKTVDSGQIGDKSKAIRTPITLANGGKSLAEVDFNHSLKKKLKMKIPPIDDNFKDAIMMEGDDENDASNDNIDDILEPINISYITPISGTALGTVLPAASITPSSSKLLTTATCIAATTPITVKKAEKSPKSVEPIKLSRKVVDGDTAANKLFQQITSGQPHIDHRRKGFRRKFKDGIIGNVDFGSDDNDSDNEASLVIANDPQDYLAAAMAQANRLKNPQPVQTAVDKKEEKKTKPGKGKGSTKTTPDGKIVPVKRRRGPLVTAYTLFARENRSKIQHNNPTLDFANVSRRLGEVWQALPNKEKVQWKRKAQKMAQSMSRAAASESTITNNSKPVSNHSKSSLVTKYSAVNSTKYSPSKSQATKLQQSSQPLNRKNDAAGYLDVACHLKLLGESLTNIGQKLNDHPSLAVSGSLSVLLDSTLCAIGPLFCLTRLIDHSNSCPKEVHEKILDNISYIMPGI